MTNPSEPVSTDDPDRGATARASDHQSGSTSAGGEMPTASAHTETWYNWCLDRLSTYARAFDTDPLTNSVQRLAHDLANALYRNDITIGDLSRIAKSVSDTALERRIERFADRLSLNSDPATVVAGLASEAGDNFDSYRSCAEHTHAGIVFTGHPTFAISKALRVAFAELAQDRLDGDTGAMAPRLDPLAHRPDDVITIGLEHDDVGEAINNANGALDVLNREILIRARQNFPETWTSLVPHPISLATWVGYDLDGRTDIHWGQTLTIRLREKAAQLRAYAEDLSALTETGSLVPELSAMGKRVAAAAELAETQALAFSGDLDDPEVVIRAANLLTDDHPDRLTSLKGEMDTLTHHIGAENDPDRKLEMMLLRARMKRNGLGTARIHLRVNAAQVRSALRHDFNATSDSDFMARSALQTAADQAQSTRRRDINFANVFLEKMTARRQFMLCAQIAKHIDEDTPIRFLIAECEAPATVMGAIYLARSYGVDHLLDISPLFETPSALERGGRFLERLMGEDAFRDYVRKRGRLSIQLGFSDSGRFMGQIAADMAIERLQILLARGMKAAGLTDVEALIFNTNGESLGRGTAPGTLEERLHHLMTPWGPVGICARWDIDQCGRKLSGWGGVPLFSDPGTGPKDSDGNLPCFCTVISLREKRCILY